MVDDTPRKVTFSNPQPTTLAVQAPFFWYNLTLDPNFGVLVGPPTACSAVTSHPTWEYFLAIPIGVVLIGVVVIMIYYLRFRAWYRMRTQKHTVSIEMDD